MADRDGVELARVGKFELSTGPLEITPQMMHDAVNRAQGDKFRAALKLGHTDPRNDGEPAFGWLKNLRVDGDGSDSVLKGDLKDVPKWLDDSADWAYPHRSIEANVLKTADGATGMEITGLALLGVTPPGIDTISSWRDLPKVLVAAAAASGTDLTVTEFRAAFDALKPTQTPAEPPVIPPINPKEADIMSETLTTGLRERLGVKPDVELDEAGLLTALDQALAERAEPVAAAAPSIPNGHVTISQDVLDELKIAASAGAEARAVQLRTERDDTISNAVRLGKIAAARREHWSTKWDKDPEGAKADLDSIEPGLIPVAASGYTGGEPTDDDDAILARLGFTVAKAV